MENQPLVSIIIPVYNGENFVREAINSALSQTYNNIEIVVVNDGSTDDGKTREACLEYEEKIKYYEKENGGCASAINYGIKKSEGIFISWLSHDDLYYPNKISHQVQLYKKRGLDSTNTIISNSGDLIDKDGNKIFHPSKVENVFLNSSKMFKYLLFNKCFNGCGLLIPKALFENWGYFREDMRFVLDWNLWLKFAVNGANTYVDNKILVSNRRHSSQVTVKQKELHQKEANLTCEELLALLKNSENAECLLDLYYFCYSTGRPITSDIELVLKQGNIQINRLKKFKFQTKVVLIRGLKKIYHSITK